MSQAIRVTDLSWAYGSTTVLSHVDFSVDASSFFTIIGPNGSGKSALMRLLAGVMKTAGDQILISGMPLNRYSGRVLARTVAYVPQSVSIEFPFSVEELVLLGRSPRQGILGMTTEEDHEIARQAMVFTDSLHLAGRRMDQISGGERQRVFIARAICQKPEIMLLDEPASALDFAHQIRLMDLLERLRTETGVTIVMVSHDINLAALYADAMLLLSRGGVVRAGKPDQVLDPGTLESVFGCLFIVETNPLRPVPRIFPVPEKYRNRFVQKP
ncbi:MAG: ABC transporter ATP-binding protein [Pseudomonadota bacterium]